MSHPNSGYLSAYNSLTDKHLAGYFNNTRIRRHLLRAGLITRNGSIVPEKEYRQKLIRRNHQRCTRQCLNQAVFHKVHNIERRHKVEIKMKLEDFARKEHVLKMKVQRSKRHSEGIVRLMSPRPPSVPRSKHTQHSGTEGEQSESSISPSSSQPSSAPGKRQRPVRLQPLYSNSTTASSQRASHCCGEKDSSDDTEPYPCGMLNRETRRHVTMPEFSSGISPYRLPVINNYTMPVPPPARTIERSSKGTTKGRTRGRCLRPTTAPNVPAVTKQDSRFHRTTVQSNVSITVMFYGKAIHLTPDTVDTRDEVRVFQQHCGGENVCVYRGKLAEGEAFRFISRRHLGFPFSLTFFLNGMQVERLSSCCEFRHRRASRLGGKRGLFGFTSMDGASPCYKCIIALGLDKKPTPPPKRLLRDSADTSGGFLQMGGVTRKAWAEDAVEHTQAHPELKSGAGVAGHHVMATETQDDYPGENEQEVHDDYEEDFEEEDGDVEEARSCAVVNGVSSCHSEEGRDSHHESEDDEGGRYSDSQVEEEKAEEKKSVSMCLGSILSHRKESPESEAENAEEAIEDSGVDPYSQSAYPAELRRNGPTVQDPETGQGGGSTTPAHGAKPKEGGYLGIGAAERAKDQPNARFHPTSRTELGSDTHDIHGNAASETSMEESDNGMPSEEKEATKWSVAKPEHTGKTETWKTKCVPERLTAAITKETHFSSELEMTDCSSDEDELLTIDSDRTPELDQTSAGVEAVAVAENRNGEVKATSRDEALNISSVGLASQEGKLRTLGMEEHNQGTAEACPYMVMEKGVLGIGGVQAQEPMEKGDTSEEEAQDSENGSTGTDSHPDPVETGKAESTVGEVNWTEQMAQDSETLTEASSLTVQLMEEEQMTEHGDTVRGQKEGTESTASSEGTAFLLEKQDAKADDTGEEKEMVEKTEETEAFLDAIVTVAAIRTEHFIETSELSSAEEETEAEQNVNGEAETMDEAKDSAKREKKEEADTLAETTNGEVKEEEGEDAQTVTGDTDSKTEMNEDTNKESLGQEMKGDNDETEQLINRVINDKEEVVVILTPNIGINEASTGESRAEERDNRIRSGAKTVVWPAKCDKITTMLEDSESADIPVEETKKMNWGPNVTDKSTERVGETESSVGSNVKGLGGESNAAESVEEGEDMSANGEVPVNNSETQANGSEIKIKQGDMQVRYAVIGSTGEENEETPEGEVPKSETETEDQEAEGRSWPTTTDMTQAVAQVAMTLTEGTLDMTEGTLLQLECAGRGMKNRDTVDQREVEEAVESSRADMMVGTPGKVEKGPVRVYYPDESELLNEETGGLEVEWGEASLVSDGGEKDFKSESEVPGDGFTVVKGDAAMKEEERKARAAVEPKAGTKAEEEAVNIDIKGLPNKSPGNSNLQEKTKVVKSEVTDGGLQLKAEDESGDQATELEEIAEPNKETPGMGTDVTECNVEGSEGKSQGSWVNTDHHRDPHSQEECSSNNTEIKGEGSETADGEGLGTSHKPGSAALEVKSTAAKSTVDRVQGRPEEEQRKFDEDEEATAEKTEGQDTVALEINCTSEKSIVDLKHSVSRSKTELGNGTKFPPPLIRRSASYALTVAREGLSLQTFAASGHVTESPLAHAQTAAAITGNAFTASNQKHITTSTFAELP